MRPIRSSVLLALACAMLSTPFSHAGGGVHNNHMLRYSEAHGMTFSEIGAPGNSDSVQIVPSFGLDIVGGVDYRYRVSRTEVTNAQYYRFVEAIAPHIDEIGVDSGTLAGDGTLVYLGRFDGLPRYRLPKGTGNEPAKNSITYFALMANWLHNGAQVTGEATAGDFQSGAYDDWTNPVRSDNAEFWIPSRDEWVKAAYWDPNRHGQNQGGYWLYLDASDDPLIPGDPALGGETSADNGFEWPEGHFKPADVGSYPDTQSPWGLLDVSGSEIEWTDTRNGSITFFLESTTRGQTDPSGTIILQPGSPLSADRMHMPNYMTAGLTPRAITVRFAASIPAPGVPGVLALGARFGVRRRR